MQSLAAALEMSPTHRSEAGSRPAFPAALLHAGLVLLNRGAWKKLEGGPLVPDMFVRPNAKGLAAALYLLYARVHGKGRAARVSVCVQPSR